MCNVIAMANTRRRGPIASFRVLDEPFYLGDKYELIKPLRRGPFGVLCAAKRIDTGERCAIKKIHPMAESDLAGRRTLREIRFLRCLGRHENAVSLKDLIVREEADELYVVMELLDADLNYVLHTRQPLTDYHFKYFMFQLLRGLRFAHGAGVFHGDLKPGKLLVTRSCDLRIADFGLSRIFHQVHVILRWYEAPELLLTSDRNPDEFSDVWSCGCIFAEMLGRRHLFPGQNLLDQLRKIFQVIGTPSNEDLEHVQSRKARKFMKSLPEKTRVCWNELFPEANSVALDLLDKMLIFDPAKRISVREALAHPYFDGVREHYTLGEAESTPAFEFSFEYERELNAEDYKRLIIEEARSFKQEYLYTMVWERVEPYALII